MAKKKAVQAVQTEQATQTEQAVQTQESMLISEHTKEMEEKQLSELQNQVKQMTAEELKTFRNEFDPDTMGFSGAEGEQ